jgi:peptidoglycan/LPS O-acetylase OafA/YrhL
MCWTWWPFEIDGHLAWFFYISWSVSTELFFYLVYALLLYRIAAIRSIRTCLVTLITFCIAAYTLFFVLFMTRDIWEPAVLASHPDFVPRVENYGLSFYRWFLYSSPYCRLPEFVGGVLTCQLFLLCRGRPSALARISPAVVGTLAIVVMAVLYAQFRYFGEHDPWCAVGHFSYGAFIVNLHQNFLFAPCCYLLIFSLARGGWALATALSSRPAQFCGDVSYSTYLSHEMVIAKLGQLGVSSFATVPYLAILLAVVYLVSWILYSVVEMPAKRMLRTLFNSWVPRRSAVPASE